MDYITFSEDVQQFELWTRKRPDPNGWWEHKEMHKWLLKQDRRASENAVTDAQPHLKQSNSSGRVRASRPRKSQSTESDPTGASPPQCSTAQGLIHVNAPGTIPSDDVGDTRFNTLHKADSKTLSLSIFVVGCTSQAPGARAPWRLGARRAGMNVIGVE
ncbi:hypothetical protein C8R43DRAFT_1139424 [Mycena crocata]|nr:hypothetical protein C8R43DRAFT_1139424 [Mycena crocata]